MELEQCKDRVWLYSSKMSHCMDNMYVKSLYSSDREFRRINGMSMKLPCQQFLFWLIIAPESTVLPQHDSNKVWNSHTILVNNASWLNIFCRGPSLSRGSPERVASFDSQLITSWEGKAGGSGWEYSTVEWEIGDMSMIDKNEDEWMLLRCVGLFSMMLRRK